MGLRFAQKLDFAGVARAGISALGAWPSCRRHAAAAPGWRRAPLMQVVVKPGPGAILKQVAPVHRAGHCAFAQHGPQRGVGAEQLPLGVQRKQANGHGIESLHGVGLKLCQVVLLQAQMFSNGKRRQHAR